VRINNWWSWCDWTKIRSPACLGDKELANTQPYYLSGKYGVMKWPNKHLTRSVLGYILEKIAEKWTFTPD
jgi:hypothetical protein